MLLDAIGPVAMIVAGEDAELRGSPVAQATAENQFRCSVPWQRMLPAAVFSSF